MHSSNPFIELREIGENTMNDPYSSSLPNTAMRWYSSGSLGGEHNLEHFRDQDSLSPRRRTAIVPPLTMSLQHRSDSMSPQKGDTRSSNNEEDGDMEAFPHSARTARTFRYLDKKWERTEVTCVELRSDGEFSQRKINRLDLLKLALEETITSVERMKGMQRGSGSTQGGTVIHSSDTEKAGKRNFRVRVNVGRQRGARRSGHRAHPDSSEELYPPICARDIRTLDPTIFSKAAFIVRRNAILITLEALRAIIFFDKVWLILRNGSSVDPVVYAIQDMINTQDIGEDIPFEFRVLEGILSCLTEDLRNGLFSVKPSVEKTLDAIERPKSLSGLDDNARKLRLLKQELNLYQVQLHGIRDALFNVLDDEEEMAQMYLTDRLQAYIQGRRIRKKDAPHEEMEMLLEFYLQDIETLISTEVDIMMQSIDHTEDLININLDTMRNRLLRLENFVSILSCAFGLGAMVGGIFGMNLEAPFFTATSATGAGFLGVSLSMIVGSFFLFAALLGYGYHIGIFNWGS